MLLPTLFLSNLLEKPFQILVKEMVTRKCLMFFHQQYPMEGSLYWKTSIMSLNCIITEIPASTWGQSRYMSQLWGQSRLSLLSQSLRIDQTASII